MNFDKIDIVKFNDKHLKIFSTENQTIKKIKFELEGIKTPFGIEIFSKMKYVNWELGEDLYDMLNVVDNSFKNHMKEKYDNYSSYSWNSALKLRNNYNNLLRTKMMSDVDFVSDKKKHNIEIEIDSIWINNKNKTLGILWLSKII